MTDIAEALRADLISSMPVERVFQKHVIDRSSYLFRNLLQQTNWEYELRDELAKALGLSIHDIVIVGSAKLGFSLKDQDFSKFDRKFQATNNPRDRSDIDVAVVNRSLFDEISKQVFSLSRHFDKEWIKNHWKINAFNRQPGDLANRYALYLAKGWLRPDLLPVSYYDSAPWRAICTKWSKKLSNRRISVGFYSEWFYLKHYQMSNLERLRSLLIQMEI